MKFMNSDTLNKNIFNFVKRFGVKKVYCGEAFECSLPENVISYSLHTFTSDILLMDYIEETYHCNIEDFFFIFSLLHEVGHCVTFNQLTEEDLQFENIMRESLLALCDDNSAKANNIYFTLPSERLATEWAIKYIDEHTEECWKAQRKFYGIQRHQLKKRGLV